MSRMPRSTIEQWAVLRAVIEAGGFAQAASVLHRSQSSVSYAVARLQEALGIGLIEIRGRRAVLTEAGAALLGDTIPLIDEWCEVEDHAKALAGGEIAHIRLVVDALFPKPRLFRALKRFSQRYPRVDIRLAEAVRLTMADIGHRNFDLAVLVAEPAARNIALIADVELVAVARDGHPLTQLRRPPTGPTLARYLRVEIQGWDLEEERLQDDPSKVWSMNTVEAAIEAVRQGLCYGWLPSHLIEADLRAQRLVQLDFVAGKTRHIPLCLRYANQSPPISPAIEYLGQLLAEPV